MRKRWGHRRVTELLPVGVSEKVRAWAASYGTDIRGAWHECDDPLVLRILAYGIGVPGHLLIEAWQSEFGPPAEIPSDAPPWEVWRRAVNDDAARAELEAWLLEQRGSARHAPRATSARLREDAVSASDAWRLRGLRAYRNVVALEDYLVFDDELLH